jgi:hypothetical protein
MEGPKEGPNFGPKPEKREKGEEVVPEGIPEEELYPEEIKLRPDQERDLGEAVHRLLREKWEEGEDEGERDNLAA